MVPAVRRRAINAALILARFTSALRSLERAERTLNYRSTYDPLTGPANRAALNQELEACPPGSTLLYLGLDADDAVGSDWRPAALLRAADTAMYRAERLGRGRWIRADAIT